MIQNPLRQVFMFEWMLLLRNRADWIPVILIYSITIALFGFCLSREQDVLRAANSVILWVSILLSMLTMGEFCFRKDAEEGWLTQLRMSATPLWMVVLGKALAFWCLLSIGFVLTMPVIAMWIYLPMAAVLPTVLVYSITLPALIFLMMLGVALTVGLPQPGLLLGLILLPLYLPILILGQSAVQTIQLLSWPVVELCLLGAISILCTLFLPMLTALTLQQSSEGAC